MAAYVDGVPDGVDGARAPPQDPAPPPPARPRAPLSRLGGPVGGAVGVFVVHDADNDGRPSSNWLGMPTEGVTASNGARGGFPIGHPCGGEPCWSDAKIAVHAASAPCVIVDMELWYP
jgi:hypothetical protein